MKKVIQIAIIFLISITVVFAQIEDKKPRDVKTIGILVGSSLIGFDYEYRATKNIGVQAGFGLIGYDVAFNWHFASKLGGAYASFTYKDTGIGTLRTIGPEYCHRIMFGENEKWGITFQLGFGYVLSVDRKFEEDYIKELDIDKFPKVILTYAIGISF